MKVNGQLHTPAVLPLKKIGQFLLNRRLTSTDELEVPVMVVGKLCLQHVAVNYVTSVFKHYSIYTASSMFRNPRFCPHSVFVCPAANGMGTYLSSHTSHVYRHTRHISIVTHVTYLSSHTSHVYRHTRHMSIVTHVTYLSSHTSHTYRHTRHISSVTHVT